MVRYGQKTEEAPKEWTDLMTEAANVQGLELRHILSTVDLQANPGGDEPVSVDWSPDGQFLASGSISGAVCVWDLARSRKEIVSMAEPPDLAFVAWSPDGAMLASYSGSEIKLWDVRYWSLADTVSANTFRASSIRWSTREPVLATGGLDSLTLVSNISIDPIATPGSLDKQEAIWQLPGVPTAMA